MAILFGTNTGETIFGGDEDDTINGWDIANLAGDFGPADDDDVLVGGLGLDT